MKRSSRPERKVKTYLTFCSMCGEQTDEVVLDDVYKYFHQGDLLALDHPGGPVSQYLIDIGVDYTAELVEEDEQLPASKYCPDCEDEIEVQKTEFLEELEKGGVRWHCVECFKTGIIVANDSLGFSQAIREEMDRPAPQMVDVRFSSCSQHAAEDDPDPTVH